MTTVYPAREVHRHPCPKCAQYIVCSIVNCAFGESVHIPCVWCSALDPSRLKPKPPSKRHQRAVAAGQESEDLWERCHNACRTAKVAHVWKIPTPTKGKNGFRRFVQRSTVDFMGYTFTGRGIAAEAKSAADGEFCASDFEEHQRDMLDEALRIHVLSLALLACDSKLRAVPWADVRDAKSFRFGDVGFPVELGEAYLKRWA